MPAFYLTAGKLRRNETIEVIFASAKGYTYFHNRNEN